MVVGEELTGYVLNVRDDGKVDVGLRPPGLGKINIAREMIMERLTNSRSECGGG